MSLRWRIALILAAVALGVGAIAGTSAWLTTQSQLHSTIDESLRATAQTLNTQGLDHGERGPDPTHGINCPPPGSFQPAAAAQIVEPDGTVLKCIAGGATLPVVEATDKQVLLRDVTVAGAHYRLLSTPWREGGTLQIGRNLHEASRILGGLRLELLALVAIVTLLTAALGWAIATRVARPIMRLRDTTEHIADTLDFTAPIAVAGATEVRSLAASFKTMIEAVRQSQDKQRRLVADASHEMRTPLTSLRSNVELLGKIERLPQVERGEVVDAVLEDIDELSSLMGELVDLASDLGEAEETESLTLGDLARTVASRTERRTGRVVSVRDDHPRRLVARPRQLERAISNLVDNALKYGGASAPVEIVVEGTSLTVLDRGRGLAPADLSRIFDRFYRAVEVRTEPGSGLGLSIVEEIVRSHGGEVFAGNRDGGGAAIGFTLPGDEA
ncbi:MAG: ATP-binding protein [Marmoricola sp.]